MCYVAYYLRERRAALHFSGRDSTSARRRVAVGENGRVRSAAARRADPSSAVARSAGKAAPARLGGCAGPAGDAEENAAEAAAAAAATVCDTRPAAMDAEEPAAHALRAEAETERWAGTGARAKNNERVICSHDRREVIQMTRHGTAAAAGAQGSEFGLEHWCRYRL